MQKTHNLEVNKLCLEGMKLATKIACVFDLATPREAFISALKNAANLNNPQEMQAKNVEALKVMLEIGQTEGNTLKQSWKDVLMCISQLDRLQLISGGVDEECGPGCLKGSVCPSFSNRHQRFSKILSLLPETTAVKHWAPRRFDGDCPREQV